VPLVWPPREGFAEDEIVSREAPAFVPMVRMAMEDYLAGNWKSYLERAKVVRRAHQQIRTDGAGFCAETLALRSLGRVDA